jgi:hypothetical protein
VKTKKAALDEAYNDYMAAVSNLRVHEAKWKAEWDAERNAFLSWAQHNHPKKRKERGVVIQQWIKARDIYNKLKERK